MRPTWATNGWFLLFGFLAGIGLFAPCVLGSATETLKTVNIPFVYTSTVLAQSVASQNGENNGSVKLPPILLAIEHCESGGRQFDSSGNVIRGKVNHLDVGILQINTHYHQGEADKLGLDLMTRDGNERFGLWLYGKEGTTPWLPSKPCWGRNPLEHRPDFENGGQNNDKD